MRGNKNFSILFLLLLSGQHVYCIVTGHVNLPTCLFCCPRLLKDAQPTDLELEVWTQVGAVLGRTPQILNELSLYRGASNEIRDVGVR